MDTSSSLVDLIVGELNGSGLSDEAQLLAYAAVEGDASFEQALEGNGSLPDVMLTASAVAPVGAYLTSVSVEGFRGVGQPSTVTVTPGPGLTVVTGRNGSGKSSFAEAIEVTLTGANRRWQGRSAAWLEGWRNLHHPSTSLAVGLVIEGEATPTAMAKRSWDASATKVEDCTAVLQRHGEPATGMEDLGWAVPLATYRPFLSYNELGEVLTQEPKLLFDALSAILGLESLTDGINRVKKVVSAHAAATKSVRDNAKGLAAELGDLTDQRAVESVRLLTSRTWDLDRLEHLATRAKDPDPDHVVLRSLARLSAPSPEVASAAAAEVRVAAARLAELGPDPDAELARLLSGALRWHAEHHGDACPVCGVGILDDDWADQACATLHQHDTASVARRAARDACAEAEKRVRDVLTPPAMEIPHSELVDTTSLLEAWEQLRAEPVDAQQLAERADEWVPVVAELTAQVIQEAEASLDRREEQWRPFAGRLMTWVQDARDVASKAELMKEAKAAQVWLVNQETVIREARLAPLSTRAAQIWEKLRQESNVTLEGLKLVGANTRRKVDIDVRVDGTDTSALAVMSQGELNALSLSVFLPRAMVPDSPFRFLVIDDPVQAMDPSKVDGLARVLSEVATQRQVLVFTHDDRLPEAVRRLGLDATIVEVSRGEGSVVTVRTVLNPVQRNWLDADALLKDSHVSDEVARRVVPGILRVAVEAACQQIVRRRRLGAAGRSHAEVEDTLRSQTRLYSLLALALFDDETRTGDVLGTMNNKFGREAADLVGILNKGAHGLTTMTRESLQDTARATRRFLQKWQVWDA